MTGAPVTAQELRRVDLFDELDDEQLQRWVEVAEPVEAAPGDELSRQGTHSTGFHILLEGTVVAMRSERPDAPAEPLGTHQAPTWIGAIPTLTGDLYPVAMRCQTAVRAARVAPDALFELVAAQRPILQRVMRQFRPVVTRIVAAEQDRERLASLGTMAAGLAHELNNPAAAARRAASDMAETLEVVTSALQVFVEAGVEREQAARLVELQREAAAHAAACTVFDALDAADAEDELLEHLEDLGVPEPWRLTEPLALGGVDRAWLDRVAAVAGPATGAALRWVAATLTVDRLASELQESTERMLGLVGAVKTYAYLDRGERVEVDLHEGLETTLTVLGHKLRPTSIEVLRDYDRELPRTLVRGSELNQVWTNLLANAIDALGERGTITVRTRRDDGCAVVEVSDDGPGIPEDLRDRIFEPFFTTKDVGDGTGLGLSTARRIVVDRHSGTMAVESEPGRTTFRVRLPLRHEES